MPSMMHADGFGMASTDGISFWSSFANVLLLVFLKEPSGEVPREEAPEDETALNS